MVSCAQQLRTVSSTNIAVAMSYISRCHYYTIPTISDLRLSTPTYFLPYLHHCTLHVHNTQWTSFAGIQSVVMWTPVFRCMLHVQAYSDQTWWYDLSNLLRIWEIVANFAAHWLSSASQYNMLCKILDCGTLTVTWMLWTSFCGKAAIHRATAAQGFTSVPFDKFRIRGITDTGDKHLT